jgi:hypothetical protein
MGHRAKNKQGSPEPLEPKPWATAKKTGKRKVPPGDAVDNKRPAKKVKGAKESSVKSKVKAKVKSMGTGAKAHLSKVKAKVRLVSPPIDADGWEDVEDGADLKL